MRKYEVRSEDKVFSKCEAENLDSALQLIAKDQKQYVPLSYSKLVRLANEMDGEERVVWIYPAAFDLTEGGKNTGLMSESEDF